MYYIYDKILQFICITNDGYLTLAINGKVYNYKLDCRVYWENLLYWYSYPIKGKNYRKVKNSIINYLKPYKINE